MSKTLATSVGKPEPHAATFLVAEGILNDPVVFEQWSDPVDFKFERLEDGRIDLAFREVESE